MYIKMLGLLICMILIPISVYAGEDVGSYSLEDEAEAAVYDKQPITTFITTARVNLRQDPDTGSSRIALIDSNRQIEVIDFRDGIWFHVNYNGMPGYMYAEFLIQAEQAEPAQQTEQAEPEVQTIFITTARVNLRPTPGTYGERITLVNAGRRVEVTDFRDGAWFAVEYNGMQGYMSAEFLRELPEPGTPGYVEKIAWSSMRNILPKNTPFTVIDVRSGLSYQMISFSHGNHADVFPATAHDTEIFRQTFGGRWDWTPRPVLVLVGGRTVAASISGMPHGTGSRNNNMNGHVCLHFLGSRTHNGNRSHERDHQNAVNEAFNTASRW